MQNRRQEVVNIGAVRLIGGFTFMQGVLTFKFEKIPFSYFNLGGLELCLEGLSPPKPPRGDGTGAM